jgi:hypothetical protein
MLAVLGAHPHRPEGNTEGIGVDRLELEGRPVGADSFHADGAAADIGPQRGADRVEPFARVVGVMNEVLGHGFQPDDLPLFDAAGLLLFRQGERLGGGKAVVDEHHGGCGAGHQLPRVGGRVGAIPIREDGSFGRVASKFAGDSADGVPIGHRVNDMTLGELGIERLGERPA